VPKFDSMEWRVDYSISSSECADLQRPSIRMKVNLSNGDSQAFEVDLDKFRTLYADLQAAKALMQPLAE
jgi:COMM domain